LTERLPSDDAPPAAASPHADTIETQELTSAELAEARRYGRKKLICGLADQFLDIVYLAIAAIALARPLDQWLFEQPLLGRIASLRLMALVSVIVLLHVCVSFPLSLYAGHVLEHRFGLSKQSFPRWLWRYAKRNGLAWGFSVAMMLGLFWVIWLTGPWWWLVAAAVFLLVSVVLGQLAPILILPLFHKVEPLEPDELTERLRQLADGTGLSISGIYRLVLSDETTKANAMLAGLGRTRRVLLGDTLLSKFTSDEIAVVFAHEIGHHVHRHIPKMLLAGTIYSIGGFWICSGVLKTATAPHALYDLPVSAAPLVMLTLTVLSILLEPLQNTISRHYERQSDRYAVQRTGLAGAYRSAFRKLARINKEDPSPHRLEVVLLHSHPPIAERLAMVDDGDEAA